MEGIGRCDERRAYEDASEEELTMRKESAMREEFLTRKEPPMGEEAWVRKKARMRGETHVRSTPEALCGRMTPQCDR